MKLGGSTLTLGMLVSLELTFLLASWLDVELGKMILSLIGT